MTVLGFGIAFAAPMRVSTGRARPGVDAAIDMSDPLPATSLKGVMRATATQLLGADDTRIGDVFGSPQRECRWEWSNAAPQTLWAPPQRATRIRVENHVATDDMLGCAEQTYTTAATFTVTAIDEPPDPELATHIAILTIAATATRALGAGRRRGTGWVHITSETHPVDAARIRTFLTGTST
ncbi:RAMP superfamily CRISPR-associated protein [Nocardia beijingensis]|uniref:RAMP superfamily CRISPR-associated protein n=1 Tax=Nocardia beijingensis TaxID=95162 RepID=UPI00344D39D0